MPKSKNKGDEHVQITAAKMTLIGTIFTGVIGVIGAVIVAIITNRPTTADASLLTPTFTVLPSPTNQLFTATPVISPTPTNLLLAAQQWNSVTFDDFTSNESRTNWSYLTEPQDPVSETYDLTFRIDVVTNGRVQYAFYDNKNAIIEDRFFVQLEAFAENQTGCDYGIIFHTDSVDRQYYWFYVNGEKYGVVSKAKDQDTYHKSIIELKEIPDEMIVKKLGVIGDGGNYKLYINDILVDEFSDDRLSGGKAGIGTITCQWLDSANFMFDNFEVRSEIK